METVIYEKREKIAYVTLNRPEVMNAINVAMMQRLQEVWKDFADDHDVWVAIVSGAGDRAFSAGHDLKEDAAGVMEEEFRKLQWQNVQYNPLIMSLGVWKPVIAAIHGHCLAGGLEIALSSDLRICSEKARFGLPQVSIGQMPSFAGVQLSRLLPLPIAMHMLLTGDTIDAQTAHHYGLVNEVVPFGELASSAERLAKRICENAPLAVRGTKQATLMGLDMSRLNGFNLEHHLAMKIRETADAKEGPRAFTEKRKPRYLAL